MAAIFLRLSPSVLLEKPAKRKGANVGTQYPKKSNRSNIFQTDKEDVRILTPYLPKRNRIWEPACGEGQIVDFLKGEGYDVVGTDILSGFDFLSTLAEQPDYDIIITNPPFSIKDQWIERCYATGKPFALLMPITAFDSIDRRRMFNKNGIQLLLPDRRAVFTTPSGKVGGSWFYAAWFCHGMNLPQQLTFVES
jgi:hypothetical protein